MLKAILLFVVAAVLILIPLNQSGFCYSEGRWLSDNELINIAASAEIQSPLHKGIYPSLDDFYFANPNCCSAQRYSSDPLLESSLIESVLGFHKFRIELFYRQPMKFPHESHFYSTIMGISPCGKIRVEWGIDAQESERPLDAKTWRRN